MKLCAGCDPPAVFSLLETERKRFDSVLLFCAFILRIPPRFSEPIEQSVICIQNLQYPYRERMAVISIWLCI